VSMRKQIAAVAMWVASLAIFAGCSQSSNDMGTTMMDNSGLGPIWTYWLIPLMVLLLVAWIITHILKRRKGPRL
jgi:hypothetical protein